MKIKCRIKSKELKKKIIIIMNGKGKIKRAKQNRMKKTCNLRAKQR